MRECRNKSFRTENPKIRRKTDSRCDPTLTSWLQWTPRNRQRASKATHPLLMDRLLMGPYTTIHCVNSSKNTRTYVARTFRGKQSQNSPNSLKPSRRPWSTKSSITKQPRLKDKASSLSLFHASRTNRSLNSWTLTINTVHYLSKTTLKHFTRIASLPTITRPKVCLW